MVEKVGGIAYDVTLDLSQMDQAEKDVARKLGRIGDEGQKLQTKFTAIAAGITAAISAIAIDGLVSKIVAAQRQFDVLYSSLKTVAGGADAAGVAWERLTAFASKTPYTLDQTVKGFVKLKALGLDPSDRAMTSFGNTASAMGKDLMQMIEAVADASTGEFERLKEFGIKAKTQGDQVSFTFQGVTTTVKNSAKDITEYLTKIGEVNFAGAMQTRMDTLDGAMSNLEDSWQALYLSISQGGIGDLVASMVKQAATAIQELSISIENGGLTEYFDKLGVMMKAAEVVGVSLAGAMIGRMIPAISAVVVQAGFAAAATVTMTSATTAFSAVISALGGPIGIAITALGLLALNWDSVSGAAKTAADISEESAKRIAKAQTKSAKAATADLSAQLKEATDGLKKAQEARGRTVATIYRKDAKDADLAAIDDRIEAYKKSISDIKLALASVDAKAGGAGYGRGSVNPALVSGESQADAVNTDKLDKWIKRYGTLAQQLALEIKEAKAELGAAFTPELEKQIRDKYAARGASKAPKPEKNTMAADSARIQADANRFNSEQNQAVGYAAGIINEQAPPDEQIRKRFDSRKTALDEMLAQELLTEQLHAQAVVANEASMNDALKRLEQERVQAKLAADSAIMQGGSQLFGSMADMAKTFAGEQSSTYKAMFAVSKAFAIADSIIKIQQAMASAAMSSPFPLNLGAMATVAASTASIISTISGTNFSGGRQYGGAVTAGSLYRVNETGQSEMFVGANGSQYMIPGRNGRVIAADDIGSSGGAGGGGSLVQNNSFNISVSVNGGGSVSAESSGTGANTQAAKQLAQMIAAGSKDTIAREMRPGGLLWKMKQGQA